VIFEPDGERKEGLPGGNAPGVRGKMILTKGQSGFWKGLAEVALGFDRRMFNKKRGSLHVCLMDVLAILTILAVKSVEAENPSETGRPARVVGAARQSKVSLDGFSKQERSPLAGGSITLRSRLTAPQWNLAPRASIQPGERMRLSLFPDADFEGLVERVDRYDSTRFAVSGRLAGTERGSFSWARYDNAVAGEVLDDELNLYEIRTVADDLIEIRQVDSGALPPCATGFRQATPASVEPLAASSARGGLSVLDIMVLYTPAARDYAGGTSAIQAQILTYISAANSTYTHSQADVRLNLVFSGEIPYTETGSAVSDLNRLTFRTDGYIDEIHPMRDWLAADVVSLLVHSFAYCGIGWMNFGEHRAFSLTDVACGSSSFVHEIGHNMGCAHDRDNAGGPGEFSFSYGHRFTGDGGALWRTVMAYHPGTRIQRFSNPNVLYDGEPTGVPEGYADSADNVRTINETAPAMAEYRTWAEQVDCNGNLQSDLVDIARETSQDCNGNSVPDECDVESESPDLNENLVPDECECDSSPCEDGIPCTLDRCHPDTGECVFLAGMIRFGDLDYSGVVDVSDVDCTILGFGHATACPGSDVAPCGGDGNVDLADILTLLKAFDGAYDCPSPCP
jgi:hypothetical protein